jgi:hypothetical protein
MSAHVTFNFLVPASSDSELQEWCRLDLDKDWRTFTKGELNWSLFTYLSLRSSGLDISCARNFVPNCVNLGHAAYLACLSPRPDAFVVSLQADYRRLSWADLHVVQNKSQIENRHMFWLPHWPQPGLVPRAPSRQCVKHVAYAGRSSMLAGFAEEWRRDLSSIGLQFRMLDPANWNDFSDIDILLAIRSLDTRDYRTKPPTKLFNAWLAGVPLVAGNDCAFSQIGTPSEDYICVTSKAGALEAMKRLKEDAAFYSRLVARGTERANEFSREKITEAWVRLLSTDVQNHFSRWRLSRHRRSALWRWRVFRSHASRVVRDVGRKVITTTMGEAALNRWRLRFR